MKLQNHIALSLPASIAIYAVSRSAPMAVASFLSGVFIDLDHIFDFVREHGFRWDAGFFFYSFSNNLYRKVVVPLHAWELVALLALGAIVLHGNGVVIGILVGFSLHLVADQMTNGIRGGGYFFMYRMAKGFVFSRIFIREGNLADRRRI